MAKLTYKYPIDEVHGKLKDTFGAAQRKAANAKGDRKAFSVNYGTRSTDPSEEEVAHRERFGAIGAMVGARRKDVTKRAADQAAFKAQTTYPTLTKYLWALCAAEYDAAQD